MPTDDDLEQAELQRKIDEEKQKSDEARQKSAEAAQKAAEAEQKRVEAELNKAAESRRDRWRLQSLRGWSHDRSQAWWEVSGRAS